MRHSFKTLFLRADTQQEIDDVELLPSYSFRNLGIISRQVGTTTEVIDDEEVEVPVMEQLEGFHANLLVCTCCMQDTIDAVASITIDTPNNPIEVFA